MDADVRVPVGLLLKAAMNACELHPCGYGYPRDQIQLMIDRAAAPPGPPEYVAYQEDQLAEARRAAEGLEAVPRAGAARG